MAGILVAEQPGLLRHIDSRLAEYVLLLRDHSSDQVQHASRWLTEILWAASRSTRARGKAEVSLRDVAICLQDLLDPEIEVEGMERDGVGGIDVVDTADVCWNIIREVQQGPDSDQTTTR
ncbi:MAG: hypothetical protein J0H66_11355 [Solirubrobacterales bacterium]|nr:hypothetical protein [Solirubrobacterales bacterium]OJU94826.1 MAG: hypothetical protein BGO23_08240 [Solirubrobacterales bacterium 67-14]